MSTLSSQLSNEELIMMKDVDFLKKKKVIISRIMDLFKAIELEVWKESQVAEIQVLINSTLKGKITRGENYNDLPFVILDCPATFSKDNIFAFRTLFWWGNYFSNSFLVTGEYLNMVNPVIDKFIELGKKSNGLIDFSENPWIHDVTGRSYRTSDQTNVGQIHDHIEKHCFFKIAWRYRIEDWQLLKSNSLLNLRWILATINPNN